MTCICGMALDGAVWIGGDSAAVGNPIMRPVAHPPKVFVKKGVGGAPSILVGYHGSFRLGQLMRHSITMPGRIAAPSAKTASVVDYMHLVSEAARACFKEGGFSSAENGVEEVDGACLIGIAGRLFYLDPDFHFEESAYGYDAIGSGAPFALGAMSVLLRKGDARSPLKVVNPQETIQLALEAASQHCYGVLAPFTILNLEKGSESWGEDA